MNVILRLFLGPVQHKTDQCADAIMRGAFPSRLIYAFNVVGITNTTNVNVYIYLQR
jgi:hypothetical protein